MSHRFLIAALLTLCSVPLAMADDWPQWRGIGRDGKSAETGLWGTWDEDGPPLVWMGEGLGEGYSSVAVVDGRIYTMGNTSEGQVCVAIDDSNGQIIWKRVLTKGIPQHGYEGSRCTPAVDGDRLYVVTSAGAIVCLATSDGEEVWRRDFSDWNGRMMSGWGFSESPLVDGDRVLCTPGGDRGLIVCLNKKNGRDIWAAQAPTLAQVDKGNGVELNDGAGYSSIVVSEGAGVKQYIQLVGRGLISVRASDGRPLWRYARVANTTANIPTPIVDGDYVFTSTAYGTGSALLKLTKNGRNEVNFEEVYWLDANQLQNKHGGMLLVDGYVYCGTGNGQGLPICVKLEDGSNAWGPVRGEGKGEASLIYADGHLVIRRDDGTVMLVEANPQEYVLTGAFKPQFQQGQSWAHPVIANGRLYLREQDKLMVYELGKE